MNHLSIEQLSARHDGALRGHALEQVDRHLAECERCRVELAALAAQDAALKPMLAHDPGESYFETFAARVDDRIRAAGLSGAQARLGGDGVFGWLRSPRKLAWAGALAAVVVGAAVVLLTQTPTELEKTALRERLAQKAPSPVAPAPESAPRSDADGVPGPALDQTAAPPAASQVLRKESDAQRADERRNARTLARDRQQTQETSQRKAVATQQRLREVRRTQSGDEVPVPDERLDRFTQPPAASEPQPVREGAGVRVRKPAAAQPLQGESRAGAPSASFGVGPADETRFCGQVVDPAGRPVAGAQVALTERGRSAATDPSGNFCLSAPPGDYELSVMAVGYSEVRQQVRVAGESAAMRLTLKPVSVLDERAFGQLGSVRGGRAGEIEFRAESADAFAELPEESRAIARNAQKLSAEATKRKSASRYDAAAAEWEKALRRLDGSQPGFVADLTPGPAVVEARYQLAAARFQAWQGGRNATRARRAVNALGAFLAVAPQGAQRDQATKWLETVRRR